VKRTSAEKISPLLARIEKEISRASDRARCARNFTPIARSRRSALEAIVRDRTFSRFAAHLCAIAPRDQIFLRDRKKNFPAQQMFKESQ